VGGRWQPDFASMCSGRPTTLYEALGISMSVSLGLLAPAPPRRLPRALQADLLCVLQAPTEDVRSAYRRLARVRRGVVVQQQQHSVWPIPGIVACSAGTVLPTRLTHDACCSLWPCSNGILTGTREMTWPSGGSSRYRRRTRVRGCASCCVVLQVLLLLFLLSDTFSPVCC
jgi:hypothetical protein